MANFTHLSTVVPMSRTVTVWVWGTSMAVSRRELGIATQLASGERHMKGHLWRKNMPVYQEDKAEDSAAGTKRL